MGHQALLRGAKVAVHNHSTCGHHARFRQSASVLAERITSKNADRWRSLPNTYVELGRAERAGVFVCGLCRFSSVIPMDPSSLSLSAKKATQSSSPCSSSALGSCILKKRQPVRKRNWESSSQQLTVLGEKECVQCGEWLVRVDVAWNFF